MTIEPNNVYNMDCRDLIRDMIRGGVYVDCVLTDPPYLINYKTGYRKYEHRFCHEIVGDDDEQLITDLMPLLYDVMKDNTPLYMFCGCDKIDFFKCEVEKYFTVKNLIVWDKGNTTAGDLEAQYGKQYEFIIYANKGRAAFNAECKRYNDIWRFNRVTGNEQIHQNQKPLDLLYRIIRQSTHPDDIILDPFMGSFTTAVACHKTHRRYIGAEIDKGYYELGSKRLQDTINQISLFDIM